MARVPGGPRRRSGGLNSGELLRSSNSCTLFVTLLLVKVSRQDQLVHRQSKPGERGSHDLSRDPEP
eukprot:372524-Rhodomonas_salina.1